MNNLYLDVLCVYVDDFGILDRDLINRIEIRNEKQIKIEIDNFLSEYSNIQLIKENECPNGFQWYYRVKNFNGLSIDFGFNLTHIE